MRLGLLDHNAWRYGPPRNHLPVFDPFHVKPYFKKIRIRVACNECVSSANLVLSTGVGVLKSVPGFNKFYDFSARPFDKFFCSKSMTYAIKKLVMYGAEIGDVRLVIGDVRDSIGDVRF